MKKLLVLAIASISLSAQSKIYMDYESDPLPLVKVNFLIPAARSTTNDTENLGLRFLAEFYDSGTKKLSRQKFQDALASYGASLEISTGYQYAEISVTFPLSNGKIPAGLGELIQDAWENPRVDKENFERSKKFLKANHMAMLDRDNALLSTGVQKIVATTLFGLTPFSTETFSKIKLSEIAALHSNYYQRKGDIWVGIIAPENLKKELEQMAQLVFPGAGTIQEGLLEKQLATGYMPEQKTQIKPTFLLIDKKDLAQIHYGFVAVSHQKENSKFELTDNFTYHVLSGAGIESVYGKNIRGERGLAYRVGGIMRDFYDYPIISLYANPQRNKQQEAFEVLDKLVQETFSKGKIIENIKEDMWTGWLLSYRNSERQSGATPEGRLERRKGIATGDLGVALFKTPIDNWTVKKGAAATRLSEIASQSTWILAAIGDAQELEPLVKKHFPSHELMKVNYKEILNDTWLKKK